jgi:hypothetical protein
MALPQLQALSRFLTMSRSRYLYGLDQTPDERLNWSPGGAAQTPLQLAGKTAAFAYTIAHLFEHRSFPERPASPPPAPESREAAKAAVEAAFARLRDTVAGLTEADLAAEVPTPWRKMAPIGEMLWWLPSVIGYLQGQLNYVQTAYGDTDPNMPPDWGAESA